MRKIIKSILNEMYTEDFWLRRIGDNNEDLIDALKKYKVIFDRRPESFSTMEEKERYFEELIESVKRIIRITVNLGGAVKSLTPGRITLNDLLSETSNRKKFEKEFDDYNDELGEMFFVLFTIKKHFNEKQFDKIKNNTKHYIYKFINFGIILQNYLDFLTHNWKYIE
jgi:hypothetical protein